MDFLSSAVISLISLSQTNDSARFHQEEDIYINIDVPIKSVRHLSVINGE